MDAEEFDQVLESDQCPECGHIWTDYKQGHYHDCRYFTLSDESDEEFRFEEEVRPWQLSLFKPAV
jgi:hypothetical protein